MPLIIRVIAENVRQREYQNARALGYSFGEASYKAEKTAFEVRMLGRDGIMERES